MKLLNQYLFVVAVSSAFFSNPAAGQVRKDLVGGIDVEVPDTSTPYDRQERNVLKYFEDLGQSLPSRASGNLNPLENLSPKVLEYLTASYLYCSIESGTCQVLLDSILEIDIINSLISSKPDCPNMVAFWKLWIADQMEQRHQYNTKVAYVLASDKFNREIRPRYIRCQGTVKEILESASNKAVFLRKRYSSDGEVAENLKKTNALFKKIHEEIPNIFQKVGVEGKGSSVESKPNKKSSGRQ